jgi:hypothetical protein
MRLILQFKLISLRNADDMGLRCLVEISKCCILTAGVSGVSFKWQVWHMREPSGPKLSVGSRVLRTKFSRLLTQWDFWLLFALVCHI